MRLWKIPLIVRLQVTLEWRPKLASVHPTCVITVSISLTEASVLSMDRRSLEAKNVLLNVCVYQGHNFYALQSFYGKQGVESSVLCRLAQSYRFYPPQHAIYHGSSQILASPLKRGCRDTLI